MKKITLAVFVLCQSLATLAVAEENRLRCFYTEVTYDAPFMSAPEIRECPENRCYYDLHWDTKAGTADVNGVTGYQLKQDGNRVFLTREAPNQIVGGVDKAKFSVDLDSLVFRAIRSTAPDVTLTIQGSCQAF